MDADVKAWIDKLMPINDFQNKFMECTQLQIDAQDDLCKMPGNEFYNRTGRDGKPMRNVSNKDLYDGFYGWKKAKKASIMTFRDQTCKSCYDDTKAEKALPKPWAEFVVSAQPYASVSDNMDL